MQAEISLPERIAILGAGREGQAAYHWLCKRHQQRMTIIAETPIDAEFETSLRAGDRVLVGPFAEAPLTSFDLLVRSPGISRYRNALCQAREAGVKVTSPSSLWFSAHPDEKTICITGTKGKSTTSALLAHLLRACDHKVGLAGNIGLPLLDCDQENVDWWVIELSSYQIADLEATPSIAVVLNFSPEHLDWHGGEDVYRRDKFRLAKLVQDGSVILNYNDSEIRSYFAQATNATWFGAPGEIRLVDEKIFCGKTALPVCMPEGLPGQHNLQNAVAALTVVRKLGLNVEKAARAIESFKSLPHRLQVVGTRKGITYINDSIASTPVATLAALEAWHGKPVILLLGGLDRGLDWSRYANEFARRRPKAVIALPENGPHIMATLQKSGWVPEAGYFEVLDLPSAVNKANELAESGDIVLLSPGAPSFPQFRDFKNRGEVFAKLCGFDDNVSGKA